MCGILGYISSGCDPEFFDKALNTLSHRGPDGCFRSHFRISDREIYMGQARLGIIDPFNSRSDQPVYDDNLCLVFNGEIYNYKELSIKYDLPKEKSVSDALMLFELFKLKKNNIPALLKELRGMFSIALLDRQKERLYLITDYFGKKPLYYFIKDKSMGFSSEIKAFKSFSELDFSHLSLSALIQFVNTNYTGIEQSIYKDIMKVPPATVMTISLKHYTIQNFKYFNIIDLYGTNKLNQGVFDELLFKAVERRFVSDVEVAMQLSSGLDSSLLALIAKKKLGYDPITYTIGMKNSIVSEHSEVQRFIKRNGIKNQTIMIESDDIFEAAMNHYKIYDEPFSDSSSLPTYILNKRVHDQGIRVLISGDGGDEFWYGYNRYSMLKKISFLIGNPFTAFISRSIINRKHLVRFLKVFSKKFDLREFRYRIYKLRRLLNAASVDELYSIVISQGGNASLLSNSGCYFQNLKYYIGKTGNFIDGLSFCDINSYLCGDIFVKNDRASMANSVEVRSPFIDSDLAEYSFSIKFDNKISGSKTKIPIRRLIKKFDPDFNFNIPKKGFSVPMIDWLKNERMKKFIKSEIMILKNNDFFDSEYIDEVLTGFYKKNNPVAFKIWNMFILSNFLKNNNLQEFEV